MVNLNQNKVQTITPWAPLFFLKPLPLSFVHSFARGTVLPHHLLRTHFTERLENYDLFLLCCSNSDFLDHVLIQYKFTSFILRSDWITFFAVDQ